MHGTAVGRELLSWGSGLVVCVVESQRSVHYSCHIISHASIDARNALELTGKKQTTINGILRVQSEPNFRLGPFTYHIVSNISLSNICQFKDGFDTISTEDLN